MKKIYVTDLENLLETELITDRVKLVIDVLLIAINDWPSSIDSLDDYDYEINQFIKDESSQKNIINYLKNIDFSKHAWHGESLTGLLNVFPYFKDDLSLREIIEELKIDIAR